MPAAAATMETVNGHVGGDCNGSVNLADSEEKENVNSKDNSQPTTTTTKKTHTSVANVFLNVCKDSTTTIKSEEVTRTTSTAITLHHWCHKQTNKQTLSTDFYSTDSLALVSCYINIILELWYAV